MQKTFRHVLEISGVGLHSGQMVNLRLIPAPIDHGIVFKRVDVTDRNNLIRAAYSSVCNTKLNTEICNEDGVRVSTIEHLMASFAGLGITNALVEINAAEVPILDGSSKTFIQEIWQTGIIEQNAPARIFKILHPVHLELENGAYGELTPSDQFEIDIKIDFPSTIIGQQSLYLNLANGTFLRELADCRTFCRIEDIRGMQDAGLALGGSLENAIVIDNKNVMNPEGFRHVDECVRHKMLDVLGDIFLCGGAIMGRYQGYMPGHTLTNKLLRKAFSEGAIESVVAGEQFNDLLPGSNIVAEDFIAA